MKAIYFFSLLMSINSMAQFGDRHIVDIHSRGATDIVYMDANSDDLKDIIVSQVFNPFNKVVYYPRISDTTFGLPVMIDSLVYPQNLAVGKFDADDQMDIVSCSEYEKIIRVYYQQANGNYQKQTLDTLSGIKKIYAHKISGIANDEIIALSADEIRIYNNLSQTLSIDTLKHTQLQDMNCMAFDDYDADGDIDFIIAGKKIMIFENQSGSFQWDSLATANITIHSEIMADIALMDYNKDGNQDLIFTQNENGALVYALNDGQGNFSNQQVVKTGFGSIHDIQIGDIDTNGFEDIALVDIGVSKLEWIQFSNQGTGIKQHIFTEELPKTRVLELADINGDSQLDIIAADILSFHLYGNEIGIVDNYVDNFNIRYHSFSEISIEGVEGIEFEVFDINGKLLTRKRTYQQFSIENYRNQIVFLAFSNGSYKKLLIR
ncbi:MAG: VCBS repeat-containing protein [Flavobacteriales bacterium]|jgi:hypothetical protein|nr:VCBS repeat-containing protein [Flavobacteriales bacterium]